MGLRVGYNRGSINLMDYIPDRILDDAFKRLGREALRDKLSAAQALAKIRGLRYLDDSSRPRAIDLSIRPWLVTSAQIRHFYRSIHLLAGALHRLRALYRAKPAIREILRLTPAQTQWLSLEPQPSHGPLSVMGRIDSTASYGHARWKTDYRMLEPNAVGVGGLHYAPTGCRIVQDVADDLLSDALPGCRITPTPDPRQLLLGELTLVARRLGCPLRSLALIENTDFTTGTDEFQQLAAYFKRLGLQAVVADPRELRLSSGRIMAGRLAVDLLYRDSELSEFIEIEEKGKPLRVLKAAIRQGRLVSSLTWEMDQKSAWEVFTDERFAFAFSSAQRAFFRSHLLWTRRLRQARVTDSAGRLVDLVPFVRANRRGLVLKPNTLFGGEGVVIGRETAQQDWERELAKALRGKQDYVAQEVAKIASEWVPCLDKGKPEMRKRSTVSGFYFSSSGIGLIGRFSPRTVVNVSQGGGLLPALWVR